MSGARAQRAAIEVRGVGMQFHKPEGGLYTALEGISFDVREGEFLSVVGPSGCGKSTLLSILGGLTEATQGAVHIQGRPVRGPLPGQVAMVFQEANLLPWKTAQKNVEFPLEFQGVPAGERGKRAREMLSLVGLSEHASNLPHQLSGGMRQRVSIARGLAQHPGVILMDEPFGALDEQARTRIGHELLDIWDKTRKTVVFITHGLSEALYLSDRILVMGTRPGRIIAEIEVPFARPRPYEIMGSEAFGELRNRLWKLLGVDTEQHP
ncbi:MAG: ABC transporter ATP-binding protein [Lautropia sp.]